MRKAATVTRTLMAAIALQVDVWLLLERTVRGAANDNANMRANIDSLCIVILVAMHVARSRFKVNVGPRRFPREVSVD